MFTRCVIDDDVDHMTKTRVDSKSAESLRLGDWLEVYANASVEGTVDEVRSDTGPKWSTKRLSSSLSEGLCLQV